MAPRPADSNILAELYHQSDHPYSNISNHATIHRSVNASPLFQLPREIRDRIWCLMAQTTDIPRESRQKQTMADRRFGSRAAATAKHARPHKRFLSSPFQLLCTCRAINKEATRFLFRHVPLTIRQSSPSLYLSQSVSERIRSATYVVVLQKGLLTRKPSTQEKATCAVIYRLAHHGCRSLRVRMQCRMDQDMFGPMLKFIQRESYLFGKFERVVYSVERMSGYCCCRFEDAIAEDPHRVLLETLEEMVKGWLGPGKWSANVVDGEAAERVEFHPAKYYGQSEGIERSEIDVKALKPESLLNYAKPRMIDKATTSD